MAQNPYLGAIFLFGGNFAPVGFATCDGQQLAISQNSALFAVIGTFYGGNGTTTFALPDFRGRVPVHMGQGIGLSDYSVGEQTGQEDVTLLQTQMPQHNHLINGSGQQTSDSLSNAYPAAGGAYAAAPLTNAQLMNGGTVGTAGGNEPHPNLQPLLAVTFIIALQGIFPSRN